MSRMIVGPYHNLVGRGRSFGATPTAGVANGAGTADANYPLAALYDGRPTTPVRWTNRGADYGWNVTANLVENGDMEQGAAGWGGSLATITSEASAFVKGTKSLKVTLTGAGGYGYQVVTAQSGWWLQLRASLAANAAGTSPAKVQLWNMETDRYLDSAGAWQAASSTTVFSTSNPAFQTPSPVTFQLPTFADTHKTTQRLAIRLFGTTNGEPHWFDEVLLVPGFDFVGAFGHNFPGHFDLSVSKQADYWHGGATSSLISVADAFSRPIMSRLEAARIYEPYLLVRFQSAVGVGAEDPLPGVGELVIGQSRAFTRGPVPGAQVDPVYTQARSRSRAGGSRVYNEGPHPTRTLTLSWMLTSEDELEELRDELWGMSGGGATPLVYIGPARMGTPVVYGRLSDTLPTAFPEMLGSGAVVTRVEGTLEEEGFPLLEE